MSWFRRGLVVLAALGLLAVATPVASAAAPTGAAPTGAAAYLRLAHLSPDTPPVDVYVGSVADGSASFVVPGVDYGAVSPYRPLPAGAYVISMRVAGADPDSAPVIATTVDARPGSAYTVAGVGASAELGLSVLDDRLDMPAPGRAAVRVINAALTAPVVDVGPMGEVPWARDVRFGTSTAYAEVPLGAWDLDVTPSGAAGGAATTLPVTLDTNSVYSVLLVDRGDGVQARLYRDSAGSAVVPTGGVETGLGGAAAPGPGVPIAPPAVVGALVLLGGAVLLGGGVLVRGRVVRRDAR